METTVTLPLGVALNRTTAGNRGLALVAAIESNAGADGYCYLRQDELAALVGISRSQTNRLLAQLRRSGVVTVRRVTPRGAASLASVLPRRAYRIAR